MTHLGTRPRVLTEQIVVRFTPELMEKLRKDSEANERTVSQTVRFVVERYLSRDPVSGGGA